MVVLPLEIIRRGSYVKDLARITIVWVKSMLGTLKTKKSMDLECILSKMEITMKDNGNKICNKAKEFSILLMGPILKENG